MIGGAARRLSKRLSGFNVDDRRSSDPGAGTISTSQSSSGKSISKISMRRFSTRYSLDEGEEEDDGSHRDNHEVISIHAVNRASEKRDSFRAELPQSLLQTHDDRDCVAPIKLEEISFGPKLGSGEYSNVFEIQSFNLQELDDTHETKTAEELEKRRLLKQCEKYRETKKARYAVKHLKGDYFRNHDSDKCIQAVSDLALEAEFLASLSHPHIMKLRGLAFNGTSGFETGPTGYFLIIDRLFETLVDRIQRWAKSSAIEKGKFFSLRRSISLGGSFSIPVGKVSAKDLSKTNSLPPSTGEDKPMDERLSVALQIAAGLKYLHSHHIIFRDLKPANIGFDVRGDVKIFDFGLARVMPDDGCPYTDKFVMSGAGTPRYMSPECLKLGESYNMKADIYSFAIILWEILSASRSYAFVKSREQLIQHVVHKDGRPHISEEWPSSIRGMMESSFDKDMCLRPKASLFYDIIRGELKKIRNGNALGLNDTWLQRRRSDVSLKNLFSSEDDVTRLSSSSAKLKMHAEIIRRITDEEEVDESFHLFDGPS